MEARPGLMPMPTARGPKRRPTPSGSGAGCSISMPTRLLAKMAESSADLYGV